MDHHRVLLTLQDFGWAGSSNTLLVARALSCVPGGVCMYVHPATQMAHMLYDDMHCQVGPLIAAVEPARFRGGMPIVSSLYSAS